MKIKELKGTPGIGINLCSHRIETIHLGNLSDPEVWEEEKRRICRDFKSMVLPQCFLQAKQSF